MIFIKPGNEEIEWVFKEKNSLKRIVEIFIQSFLGSGTKSGKNMQVKKFIYETQLSWIL